MKIKYDTIAVILGDMDLLRPLAAQGIPCAPVADRGALPRYSRYAREVIEWADPWTETESLIEILSKFGARKPEKPILFYESDADLLMISRNRDRLGEFYRFVIADAELTEKLVDKLKFQQLAEIFELPVPPVTALHAANFDACKNDLKFPVILKPSTRKKNEWASIAGLSKGVRIETSEELEKFMEFFGVTGIELLAQEFIPGDESAVESYHVYVDAEGKIAGEFTGKKIRTLPKAFGQSCALTITDASDVAQLGRAITEKLGLRGVAKFDFKRAPDGRLFLLGINPRFNLWHHLGAAAGVNLPMLVYADLVSRERPVYGRAKAGTNWCRLWQDVFSAREEGISFARWLVWAARCEAKAGLSLDDPFPIFGAACGRFLKKITRKLRAQRELPPRKPEIAPGK
jgi:predicted ATP-grasp superfamily ATP-dependent carboligase